MKPGLRIGAAVFGALLLATSFLSALGGGT